MPAINKYEAVDMIGRLDLTDYTSRAIQRGTLKREDRVVAEGEYRQFLLLVWINQIMSNSEYVVPNKRADAIWHEHILDTAAYRSFSATLTGKVIEHFPGLRPGTREFNRGVEHTKKVQRDHGGDSGFVPLYTTEESVGGKGHGGGKSDADDGGDASSCGCGCGG